MCMYVYICSCLSLSLSLSIIHIHAFTQLIPCKVLVLSRVVFCFLREAGGSDGLEEPDQPHVQYQGMGGP